MPKGFVAVDLNKNVFEFSQNGIDNLKELHKNQGLQGWQYGSKSELSKLLGNVITPQEAKDAVQELAKVKEELEKLKAKKDKKEANA